jgi:hypothetical protein
VGRRVGRCHGGGEADLAIIGTLAELSAELGTLAPKGRSGMASATA